MRARYVIAAILIAGAIAFLFLRTTEKREVSKCIHQESQLQGLKTNLPGESVAKPPAETSGPTNGPLAKAYQMARFIDTVYDSTPREHGTTRIQLKGLQVMFFVTDYIMAAKTNTNLVLSTAAIINAFTNISPDTSIIRSKLTTYAE